MKRRAVNVFLIVFLIGLMIAFIKGRLDMTVFCFTFLFSYAIVGIIGGCLMFIKLGISEEHTKGSGGFYGYLIIFLLVSVVSGPLMLALALKEKRRIYLGHHLYI